MNSTDIYFHILQFLLGAGGLWVAVKGFYTHDQRNDLAETKTRVSLLEQKQDDHTKGLDKLNDKLDDLWRQ